jgi:hypothetical protein
MTDENGPMTKQEEKNLNKENIEMEQEELGGLKASESQRHILNPSKNGVTKYRLLPTS